MKFSSSRNQLLFPELLLVCRSLITVLFELPLSRDLQLEINGSQN
jgi:hypothetical protein